MSEITQGYLSTSLQENLLTLLCFDKKNAPLIINSVPIDLYESAYYRDIAHKAMSFYKLHKDVIGVHIADMLETELKSKNKKADIYDGILHSMHELNESINSEYVMSQLEKFIRQQNLKLAIKGATELILAGKLDEAEAALEAGRKSRINLFNKGTELKDTKKILKALDSIDNFHHIGIPELDTVGICPSPKELYVIVALPGYGKSWFLTHIGKNALMQRKKVLHVTLEMSEEKTGLRYLQACFSISKEKAKARLWNAIIKKPGEDKDQSKAGSMVGLSFSNFTEEDVIHEFIDPKIGKYIESRFNRGVFRNPQLIIKEFPTGALSINGLKAYLDNLESMYNWIPDILMVDYADLMLIDTENLRVDTGRIYKELRGIGVERNIAVVTPSQANRGGQKVNLLTRENLSEDFSKVMIADNVITFNQTPTEYEKGLARLYVDKGRNDVRAFTILVAQNYSIGQFCLSSARIGANYWAFMKEHGVFSSMDNKKPIDPQSKTECKEEEKK